MWLMICLIVIVIFIMRSEYEKKHFLTERTEIVSSLIHRNYTMVFLSDLHNNEFGDSNEKLLRAIDEIGPDLVLIGGDMMICKGETDVGIVVSLVRTLAKKYRIIYGNGNHENRMKRQRKVYGDLYESFVRTLDEFGVTVLQDDTVAVFDDLVISGIDLDKVFYEKFAPADMDADYIRQKLGEPVPDKFQVLLMHSPLFFKASRAWGADLTLSGHFHGGTIRLPVLGGVMTPQFQFFLPWCAGEFEEGGRHMIVSRGLGTHSINIRLNDKPQLVVVDLKAAAVGR